MDTVYIVAFIMALLKVRTVPSLVAYPLPKKLEDPDYEFGPCCEFNRLLYL